MNAPTVTDPRPLRPAALDALPYAAPYLALDLDAVERAYLGLHRALPEVALHYAVKCNPEPALLGHLHALGAGFEVASLAELELLVALGVDARRVLFSNPVKPSAHVAGAWQLGLHRFAVDSSCELEKLAVHAPGARVYVRLEAPDATSRVPLAGKFGVDAATAVSLLVQAWKLGLVPHGLTFHVGSQSLDPSAYARGIALAGDVMRAARVQGLRLALLDIGGGFPAHYTEPVPPLEAFGRAIAEALIALPYTVRVVAEPGRAIVAEAGVLATTVIGVADRTGTSLGPPRRRRLQRDDGDARDPPSAHLPARLLVARPASTRSVRGDRADVRQRGHAVPRRPPPRRPAAGRPPVHRQRRRVHDRLRLAVQRV